MSWWDKVKSAGERVANYATGGRNDRKRSESIVRWAKEDEAAAKERVEKCREDTNRALQDLGELKLKIFQTTIKDFVSLYELIAPITSKEFKKNNEDINQRDISSNIRELKSVSDHAQEILIGGGAGAVGGATLAFGAWGLAGMVGTASTGTAIGTLSGVAATNATLAWLGGGAASAGGLGVAGGTAVLGGVVLLPAAVLAMYFGKNQAHKQLNEARDFRDNVEAAVAEMETFIIQVSQIEKGAKLLIDVINSLDVVVKMQNTKMRSAIKTSINCAERLQKVLEIEIIDIDGQLNSDAIQQYKSFAAIN